MLEGHRPNWTEVSHPLAPVATASLRGDQTLELEPLVPPEQPLPLRIPSFSFSFPDSGGSDLEWPVVGSWVGQELDRHPERALYLSAPGSEVGLLTQVFGVQLGPVRALS